MSVSIIVGVRFSDLLEPKNEVSYVTKYNQDTGEAYQHKIETRKYVHKGNGKEFNEMLSTIKLEQLFDGIENMKGRGPERIDIYQNYTYRLWHFVVGFRVLEMSTYYSECSEITHQELNFDTKCGQMNEILLKNGFQNVAAKLLVLRG